MMNADSPLRRLLDDGTGAFSRHQRALAKHIVANYQGVAFSTVKELAGAAGVSEATVVRFAKALRFKGYPDFQREIRRIVRADMKGTERFQHTLAAGRPDDGPLAAIIEKESENIAALRDTLDRRAFAQAVAALRKARDILVIGARSAAPLAQYLWFGLDKLDLPANCAHAVTSETYDRLNRMPARACVVVIGFPRYLRELATVLDFARRRALKTITITDSPYSALRGDITLHAPAVSASFVASLSAPLILLNGLLHHLSLSDRARTLKALNRFEALAESQAYFLKS
jgi:DNA-binding MurR/RpiR family transcriptional regulator